MKTIETTKKIYKQPLIEFYEIEARELLAGSTDADPEVEVDPWQQG